MENKVYEKKSYSLARRSAIGVSSRLTRLIASHFGDKIPMYCVCEYPRSGGTWLANMMADYLRCGRPGSSILPIAMRSVIHNHWDHHRKLKRVVYLYRDGRDVLTSLYFYRIRAASSEKNDLPIVQRLRQALGANYDPDDTQVNLPKFIDYEFRKPASAGKHNWASHVLTWYDRSRSDRILYLSYEQLIEDPAKHLRHAIEHVSPIQCDERLIQRTVDHYNMQSITGRKPGEESRSDFVRKGIAGDWLNYFTQEAAEIFNQHAGEALIRLGYEQDLDWYKRTHKPDALPANG